MNRFTVDGRYAQLLSSVGLNLCEILIKSELPEDLLSRKNIKLTKNEYFRLMGSIDKLITDEKTMLEIATLKNIETFSPPIFAAFCSKNAQMCIERLAEYKKLILPMTFEMKRVEKTFSIELTTGGEDYKIVSFLEISEFIFLINFIRTATKEHIIPLEVTIQNSINTKDIEEYLGCKVYKSCKSTIVLSLEDSLKPFISENEAMWDYFEPELKRRLSQLEADDSFEERVKSSIIELLPIGCCSIEDVSAKLGVSARTLQRKLSEEKTTFQKQLNHTRELLAKNYIKNADMTSDDIAFLLGYQDLNSFLRAFQKWTEMTITEYKKSM